MSEELLAGAVNALRAALRPLAFEQPVWTGQPRWQDSLYQRMRDALTAATTMSGAPMQASKAPARIDVLCWFVEVDHAVGIWQAGGDTLERLQLLHDKTWTPEDVAIVKAIAGRCEQWVSQAKDLLGDSPPVVPLRRPCPRCSQLWFYPTNKDIGRTFALQVSEAGAHCRACKARWTTDQEIGVLIKMLADTA